MKITGRTKEDFRVWYNIRYKLTGLTIVSGTELQKALLQFNKLPLEFRYGVFVDFFDSVNIYIRADNNGVTGWFYSVINGDNVLGHSSSNNLKDRPDARLKAIQAANEMYTKQKCFDH